MGSPSGCCTRQSSEIAGGCALLISRIRNRSLDLSRKAEQMRSIVFLSLVLMLTGCGVGSSGGVGARSLQSTAPTADAGSDRTVDTGAVVSLDGSGSSDPDGDSLTFSWSFQLRPSGSNASLSDETAQNPSFRADIAGQYVLELEVSDGSETSAPVSVTITAVAPNTAPEANAGNDQNVATGATVQLDGSASIDSDGDLITYAWTVASSPDDSAASLSDATIVNPTFVADLDGQYTLQLVVADSELQSAVDSVTITAETANSVPVADAGPDQNVATNSIVSLNGSASSDADNEGLSYQWEIQTKPEGSAAQLDDATAATPSFIADVDGTYVVSLTVNDGKVDSSPDNLSVVSTTVNSAPVANAGADQRVPLGAQVNLDGGASSDANGDTLTFRWQFSSVPAGSSVDLLNPDAQTATFTPYVAGTYVVNLTVNDGAASSNPDPVSVTVLAGLVLEEVDAFFGNEQLAWPYSSSATISVTTNDSNCTLGSFRLMASGGDFTIVKVSASSAAPAVTASFSGLTESQTVSDGSSLDFSLMSSDTAGAVSANYSFEVLETGDTFDVSLQVDCSTP